MGDFNDRSLVGVFYITLLDLTVDLVGRIFIAPGIATARDISFIFVPRSLLETTSPTVAQAFLKKPRGFPV